MAQVIYFNRPRACKYLGRAVRDTAGTVTMKACAPCGGNATFPVFACQHPEQLGKPVTAVDCSTCPLRQDREETRDTGHKATAGSA